MGSQKADVSVQHDWRIITGDDGKPVVVEMTNTYMNRTEPYHQFFCAKCKQGTAIPTNSYRGLPFGPCLPKECTDPNGPATTEARAPHRDRAPTGGTSVTASP